jgi:hypothetical protein
VAQRFDNHFKDTSNNRPMGYTSKGYICVLQVGMQPGDVVAVLSGGRVPYVIRPVAEGKYRFLSEVYVEGLMEGEALFSGDLLDELVLI